MADAGDDMMRTRIDASSARLTSLRQTTAEASVATARRPKFVPKAARRRTGGDAADAAAEGGASGTEQSGHREAAHGDGASAKPQRAGDLTRDSRGRGGRGGDRPDGARSGRGRGRGRGANLPTGRVAFVGTLSGGSSYSSGGSLAPRSAIPAKSMSAADGGGISVLDDENGAMVHDGISPSDVEEQWPPVVKSLMEPMSLPFARRPEPPTTGAVFCDQDGQFVLPNDTLLFLQLPTTLPLASATRVGTTQKAEPEASETKSVPLNKFAVARSEPSLQEVAKKDEDMNPDEIAEQSNEEQVYDRSIATAPGGFVGKLCVLRSGKVVLMLGDKKFDVATAHTPAFSEELFSIDKNEQQLCMLGPIDRHLVVTPDFDALLS